MQDGHALLHFAYSAKNKKRQSANVRASLEDDVLCLLSDDENVLEYFGALKRTAVLAQQGSIEKCSGLHINSAGSLLAAQSTGKIVEVSYDIM